MVSWIEVLLKTGQDTITQVCSTLDFNVKVMHSLISYKIFNNYPNINYKRHFFWRICPFSFLRASWIRGRACETLCYVGADENRSGWMLMCHSVIKRAITPVSHFLSSQSFRSADEIWYCLGYWHQSLEVSNLISGEINDTADNKKKSYELEMNKLAETVFLSRSFLVMLAMLVVWLWDVSLLVSQFWPDLNDWLTIICCEIWFRYLYFPHSVSNPIWWSTDLMARDWSLYLWAKCRSTQPLAAIQEEEEEESKVKSPVLAGL